MGFLLGLAVGLALFLILRFGFRSIYTVDQNERAVITSFGRAERIEGKTTLDDPISEHLGAEERERYKYPQLKVRGPGGPYFKMPWQQVHKVPISVQTISVAFDPTKHGGDWSRFSIGQLGSFGGLNLDDLRRQAQSFAGDLASRERGTESDEVLEAVTNDQLNIGITGQMRYKICERNLYAYLFGVKTPIAHVMGYFVSILRERIANFQDPQGHAAVKSGDGIVDAAEVLEGISINDLRKNLNDLNAQMDRECRTAAARYGIELDASLITSFDPPPDVDSALAAINTAHNEVSAEISSARALADQKIEQSKRAVEIETMRAQAEVQPFLHLARELSELKKGGAHLLEAFRRNVRLDLYEKATKIFLRATR
jgi:regulator of protease activity HflC (stomatin/prohibitin superfamily)